MNISSLIKWLIGGTVAASLATAGFVWSAQKWDLWPTPNPPGIFKRHEVKAPEIDAAAGASSIALVSGLVLLMKERSRSRRS